MSLLTPFYKTFGLPGTLLQVLKAIKAQQRFLEQQIDPLINRVLEHNDGSIGKSDLDKIHRYYGLAVPAILGEAFATLRGTPMTAQERLASTAQGAMTGLFDDFFDKDYLSDQSVEQFIRDEGRNDHSKTNQVLFNTFFRIALENVPDRKAMLDALFDVYNAQVKSKLQLDPAISTENLLNITFHKGGSSVLFYRTAFSAPVTGKERDLVFNLGALMQLGNDIFDVFKDREGGINTLVTTSAHIAGLRILLTERLGKYSNDAFALGYPKEATRRFLDILSVGIFSRCLVCLDQLEGLEKHTGDTFCIEAYNRKQLICDMDTLANKLRSAAKHINCIP